MAVFHFLWYSFTLFLLCSQFPGFPLKSAQHLLEWPEGTENSGCEWGIGKEGRVVVWEKGGNETQGWGAR